MFARCCAVSRITFGRVKLQRNRIIPIIVTMMLGDNSDFSICLKSGLPPFIIITPCVHEQILNIVTYAVRPVSYTHLDVYKRQGISRISLHSENCHISSLPLLVCVDN